MATDASSPGYIKIDQLSKTLGITMPTLRRWEKNQSMPPSIRFGGRIRFWKVSTLKQWITTLESIPATMQDEVCQGLEAASQNNVNINPKEKK